MQSFVSRVRHESRRLIRELGFLDDAFAPAEVTHPQCHVILELGNYGSLTALDLSNYLNLDKSTISRVVQQLQQRQLVEVKPSEEDRRKKVLRLTGKGQKKCKEINKKANEIVEDAVSQLSKEDIKKVVDGMRTYAKGLRVSRIKKEFKVRRVRSGDNPRLTNLIHTVMPEFGCDGPGFAMGDAEVSQMYEAYTQPKSCYFVLERKGKIVGGAGIAPLEGGPQGTCELRKMYFLPEARGTGLGREMLQLCLREAKKLGFSKCYLETTHYMTQARRLYERTGFKQLSKPLGKTGHGSCDSWYVFNLRD